MKGKIIPLIVALSILATVVTGREFTINPPQQISVGSNPTGVVCDGANIWVTNVNSNTVTKLRASDGSTLGTFSAGMNPVGIAFDGANIWVANANSNTISKLQESRHVENRDSDH